MNPHIATIARELLAERWRPQPERCFVARNDGTPPRLVDHDVWLAMREILEAEKSDRTGAQ